jgi:DHA1 family bicyclomycin/chloramphenicol resistance-like MFS transporter
VGAVFLVAFVGTIFAFQPLSTDLYLPSVPSMATELNLSVVAAQGTFLAYLLGFALGQLPSGALADRWGRRPVMLAGAAGYALSAAWAALATSGDALLAARAVLGLSVAAMTVAGRAAIRDGFDPEAGEQAMAKCFAGMGISAVLAGALGGQLAQFMDWRSVLGLLAISGGLFFGWTWWSFRPAPAPVGPAGGAAGEAGADDAHGALSTILAHPGFWLSTLLASVSYAEAASFVNGSSLVLPKLYDVSPAGLGWTLTVCSGCFLISTVACQGVLRRWGGRTAMRLSTVIGLVAAGLFAWSYTLQGEAAHRCLLAAQMTFMLAHAPNQVCGQASAVAPFPAHAGLAAAWSGTIMICFVVLWGQGQALWLSHGLERFPLSLVALALLSAGLAWMQSRHEAAH